MTTPRDRLRTMRDELRQQFLERNDLIDGLAVALLAGQHVLVIGPPGTAKSMIADELCRRVSGAQYFQWLLTRFTTPEELFGAVSLKALEADDYRRLTTHKLPEAHVAFLDEVFKASSSILNTILALMNERRFHNGQSVMAVPLVTLVGASNELPEEDELLALQDRFLLRFVVGYIAEDFRFLKLLQARAPERRTTIALDELAAAQADVAAVTVPDGVLRAMTDLRRELARREIVPSDRRWTQSLGVLRAHAWLDGRGTVAPSDLTFLAHVLWGNPDERRAVGEAIATVLHGAEDEIRVLLYQSRELRDYALREWESTELRARAAMEAHTKLRAILGKVDALLSESTDARAATDAATALRTEIARIQAELLERL